MTPVERFLEQIAKLLEETASVLKRTEQLLTRALAVRDGIAPDPVQRCGALGYTREDRPKRPVCDLEINHRGNHATGGVFWRMMGYSQHATCAAQQPGYNGEGHLLLCERPALHDGDHDFTEERRPW